MNFNIRKKLILSFLLISSVPFLFVSFFAVLTFKNEKESDIRRRLRADSRVAGRSLDKQIKGSLDGLQDLAFRNGNTLLSLHDFYTYPPSETDDMRKATVESYFPHFSRYFQDNTRRIILVINARDNSNNYVGEILFSARQEFGKSDNRIKEDSLDLKKLCNGSLVLRPGDDNPLAKAFFADQMSTDAKVYGFANFNGEYSLFLTAPVFEEEEVTLQHPYINHKKSWVDATAKGPKSLGMVVVQVDLNTSANIFGDYNGIGETILVGRDATGKMILHSPTLSLRNEKGDPIVPGQPVPGFLSGIQQASGLVTINDHMIIATPLKTKGLQAWIVTLVNRNQLLAPITKMIRTFIVLGGIGIVLIVLFVLYISNSFAQPLKKLALVLHKIKESGDFSIRAKFDRSDEIGQTATAVNDLLDTLQASIGNNINVMEAMASGDLSQRINDHYQGTIARLNTSVNRSLEMLSRTMHNVSAVSDKIETGSAELDKSANIIAEGTLNQAESVEQITETMAEINSQSQENDRNAIGVQQLVSKMLTAVEEGNEKMAEMIESMNKINATSLSVKNVIKVIDEISFQTNLLALNAAVEAARAGKYGKGFAVVAEEVRALAARSTEAAKDTTQLIENSVSEVKQGSITADATSQALAAVDSDAREVNDLITRIVTASRDQAQAIQEINRGLEQVNRVVQQNSATSQQTAAASVELSGQAKDLKQMMNQFVLVNEPEILLEESSG